MRLLKHEGFHVRRNTNVGPYVFDFAILAHRLLIELDGRIHDLPDVAAFDCTKQAWAEEAGYRVLRIANDDIWSAPDRVLDGVRLALKAPHPYPSLKGEGT